MRRIRKFLAYVSCAVTAAMLLVTNTVPANAESDTDTEYDRPFELTDRESEIVQAYEKGNLNEGLDERKALVKKYKLQDYVDSQYFLTPEFYEQYGIYGAVDDGLHILENPKTEKVFIDAGVDAGDEQYPGTVTKFSDVDWNYPGGYVDGTVWEVTVPGYLKDQECFCSEGFMAPPMQGTPVSIPVISDDLMLRKVLYYSANGPDNRMNAEGWSRIQQIVFTNDLVSQAHTGDNRGKHLGTGWIWWDYAKPYWDKIVSWPDPPADYMAYIVDTKGTGTNWQGLTKPTQDLAYGDYEPDGSLELKKSSTDPDITGSNDSYNLQTAEYTLYTDESCQTIAKDSSGQDIVLTMNEPCENPAVLAWSKAVKLKIGTYWLKETKPGTGYAKDDQVYRIDITANGKVDPWGNNFPNYHEVELKEKPQYYVPEILLKKTDESGTPLANAEFTVKYWQKQNADTSTNPARTWVFKTDTDGTVKYADSYKVSGDALYTVSGQVGIPLGTIEIQETKSPDGYYLSGEKTVLNLAGQGDQQVITTFNTPEFGDATIKLKVFKQQDGTGTPLGGAVFEHTKPDGTTEEVTTDQDGTITLDKLAVGDHQLTETKAPEGYELNHTIIKFNVSANGVTITSGTESGTGVTYQEGDKQTPGQVTVTESVSPFDLELIKVNEDDRTLPGAEFILCSDPDCQTVLETQTTNDTGVLTFENIQNGVTYYFKETKAPAGYRIPLDSDGKVHVYELKADFIPAAGQYNFTVDGTTYTVDSTEGDICLKDENGKKVISITVTNYEMAKLPETGSSIMLLLMIAAAVMVIGAVILNRKSEKD